MRRVLGPAVSMAMALVLVAGVFASGGTEAGLKQEPALEIRIMNRVNPQVSFENNPMIKEIERRTNTRIIYEAPPINNWEEKQNIVMASGDIPDIMYDWGLGANYEKWALQGLFVDLDKYGVRDPAKYPNINHNVTAKHWSRAEVPPRDYHAFTVPRSHYIAAYGPAYRKDWLEKLKLPYPLTVAQFESVCEAFARGDPDGNGRADTYAYTLTPGAGGAGTLTFLRGITGYYQGSFDPITKKLYLREEHPAYERFIRYLRAAYEKQWLEPEFITNKTYSDRDKFLQGKIGLYESREGELINVNGMDKEIYRRIVFGPPAHDEAGRPYYNMWLPSVWGGWCVAATSEQKTARILSFLDYMYSMEGRILNTFGIKGMHYNSYDPSTGVLDMTPEQFQAVQSVTSIYVLFARADAQGVELSPAGFGTPMYDVIQQGLKLYGQHAKLVWLPVTKDVDSKFNEFDRNRPEVQKDIVQAEFQYIMGQIPEGQWRAAAQKALSARMAAGLDQELQKSAPKYQGVVD